MSKDQLNKPRKAYAKPCIAIEDFTLNQFITSCDVDTRDPNWKENLFKFDRLAHAAVVRTNQFTEQLGCSVHADAVTSNMDTLCYHTSTSPLFAS